ncbi:MAG TPA: glycosyltransferase family 1 protein [Anaerolineales bacterium]|nr:glycosyltransferase family 1 protein [Anaerolineales bacterium]
MTREIVVNGRFLSRRITGVERHGREILSLFNGSCRVERTRMNGPAGHAWEQFLLPRKLKPETVLWSPANSGPIWTQKQAVTIHDLSPLEHSEWFDADFAAWYRLFLPLLVKRAQVIFTPSHHVKQKMINRFNASNVIVIPNGVDTVRFHPDAIQNTYELPEKFILFVGTLQPRKNFQILLSAWDKIKDKFKDHWLIVVGDIGRVFAKTSFVTTECVRFLGYVREKDLPGIYAKARAFILPSFDEGFGLPALEAMACGIPVIVSDGGALPETVGDAGLIFKATDVNDLTGSIEECLSDNGVRTSLVTRGFERAKQFTWQKSAETVWKALNEI